MRSRDLALGLALLVVGCEGNKASPTAASSTAATAASASGAVASASATPISRAADDAALRALLADYKKAIYARDGEKAAALVAEPTITYFEAVRKDALYAAEADVRKKPLMDRLMVVIVRARVDADRLRKSDGKGLFVHAVNEGMVGEEARTLEPGAVEVEGDLGKIGIRSGKDEVPPDLGFRAYRESGTWKLDVMSVSKIGAPALQKVLQDIDPDVDQAMLKLLEMMTGRKIGLEIYKPIDPPK